MSRRWVLCTDDGREKRRKSEGKERAKSEERMHISFPSLTHSLAHVVQGHTVQAAAAASASTKGKDDLCVCVCVYERQTYFVCPLHLLFPGEARRRAQHGHDPFPLSLKRKHCVSLSLSEHICVWRGKALCQSARGNADSDAEQCVCRSIPIWDLVSECMQL